MRQITLKFKIILIFLIPAIALAYFSFAFVLSKYDDLNKSSIYRLSAEVTESMSKLVHNLQIERGLSAGFIVAENQDLYIEALKEQFDKSDAAYKRFLSFVESDSDEKRAVQELIRFKNEPLIKEVMLRLHGSKTIRAKVLSSEIGFDDETAYYSEIISRLLLSIKIHMSLLSLQSPDTPSLSKLQELKEKAGLERAHIYNQLLSNTFGPKQSETIKELQLQQVIEKKEFMSDASVRSTMIYAELMDDDILNKITLFRDAFSQHAYESRDASRWFDLATSRIDRLEEISTQILARYIHRSQAVYSEALTSLYLTVLLWGLSLIALVVLSYILKVLLKHEEEYTDDLRIAAYTFDSHEAMTVTDVKGTIIRVNRAFTRITGYEAAEVIGKNPRVLKSMRHSDEFYKEMWYQLNTAGMWSDEIYNRRKSGEVYLERLSITAIKDDNGVTTHYIAQFLDISDVKKAQEEAEHQAGHDFLTGLLNRKSLMQRLKEEFVEARKDELLHAYLFIDLDEFKSINDNYGHDTGDRLLIEVASRMRSVLREDDVLARMSGDEFAILLLDLGKESHDALKELEEICIDLLEQISGTFILNEYKVEISASIGAKLFPEHEKNIEDVIVYADAAMYEAKRQGKNRFVFFDKAIELRLKQFALLEEELRHAYANGDLRFYFQPKVDTYTNELKGAEMLLRWQHPTKGVLYPDAFLDVASEIGMIPKITRLALQTACEFLSSNSDLFEGSLAINIGSNELTDPMFVEEVIAMIERYAVDASKIELEITENELIRDFDVAISKIRELQAYGVSFSIDDFGTGYSSITYLQRLPIDILKIDRDFMADLSKDADKELVKMIINVAQTFNMQVVVEGVEDEAQLRFIQKSGAQQYQGSYFSAALEEEGFIKMLKMESSKVFKVAYV